MLPYRIGYVDQFFNNNLYHLYMGLLAKSHIGAPLVIISCYVLTNCITFSGSLDDQSSIATSLATSQPDFAVARSSIFNIPSSIFGVSRNSIASGSDLLVS